MYNQVGLLANPFFFVAVKTFSYGAQQYFSYIVTVTFIGGVNQSTGGNH
jgi:hypothetical protein